MLLLRRSNAAAFVANVRWNGTAASRVWKAPKAHNSKPTTTAAATASTATKTASSSSSSSASAFTMDDFEQLLSQVKNVNTTAKRAVSNPPSPSMSTSEVESDSRLQEATTSGATTTGSTNTDRVVAEAAPSPATHSTMMGGSKKTVSASSAGSARRQFTSRRGDHASSTKTVPNEVETASNAATESVVARQTVTAKDPAASQATRDAKLLARFQQRISERATKKQRSSPQSVEGSQNNEPQRDDGASTETAPVDTNTKVTQPPKNEGAVQPSAVTSKRTELPSTTSSSSSPSFTPVASARLSLTSAELIQEGSPQHFVSETPSLLQQHQMKQTSSSLDKSSRGASSSIHRAAWSNGASVAFVDLIGRVVSRAERIPSPAGGGASPTVTPSSADVVLRCQFHAAMSTSSSPVEMDVHCVGEQLSLYAQRVVEVGGLIHASGQLGVVDGKIVVVLPPLGGNLLVLQSAKK